MKKLKFLFLMFSLVAVLFSGCDLISSDEVLRLQSIVSEKDAYLEAVNKISDEFMSANFTVQVKSISNVHLGSAVIFKKEVKENKTTYYLLTCQHVIENANKLNYISKVIDYKDTEILFSLEYESINYDLAVISFRSEDEYYIPKLAEKNIRIGEGVFAIGQPEGQRNSVTFGYAQFYRKESYEWADIDFECLFHTALIKTGNSGGALIDKNLQIVGINFAAGNYKGDAIPEDENQIAVSVPVVNIKEFLAEYDSLSAAA